MIEVKSAIPEIQDMLSNLDRKARLAPGIARPLGWAVRSVSRLLVLPTDRTARRRVQRHEATFAAALPMRTAAVKRWLRAPSGALAGVLFLPDSNQGGRRQGTRGPIPTRPQVAETQPRATLAAVPGLTGELERLARRRGPRPRHEAEP